MSTSMDRPAPTDLAGNWFDEDGNTATIGGADHALTFTSDTPAVWWDSGTGSFPNRGLGDPFTTEPFKGTQNLQNNSGLTQNLTFCATGNGRELVFGNGIRWNKKQAPLQRAQTPISLTGKWIDTNSNYATITDDSGQLTFKPVDIKQGNFDVWWDSGTGSWDRGQGDPFQTEPFKGTQTLRNSGGLTQILDFCVAGDGKSIVFGNGIKWTRTN